MSEWGSKYQKRGIWWVKFYDHGKLYRESTGLRGDAGEKAANRRLARAQTEIEAGTFQPKVKPLTFEEVAAMLEQDYTSNERKSLKGMRCAVKHLRGFFKGMRADEIPAKVGAYIIERKAVAKAGSVQLEIAFLKRMLRLAHQVGRLPQLPYIQTVQVRNTRQGFFEEPELRAVLKHLPAYLHRVVEFGYLTGWRRGEILGLQWRQVDFQAQTIRLEPGTTKNDDGRVLPFSKFPTLAALLKAQREHTTALERATATLVPWVFHLDGAPIGSFYRTWDTSCKKARVPGRIFHDLRRTAVRNLERAGVPRSHAMKITGHKTESVFRRYAIVCEADLAEAGEKLERAALERAQTTRTREA